MKNLLLFLPVFVVLIPKTTLAQDKDSITTLPTVTITSVKNVDARLSKAFRHAFPKAKDARWSRINKNFLVKFIRDDMKHQTLFQKNGYIKYDISYGMAHDLPMVLGEQIIAVYKGYDIANVAKIVRYKEEFWIINLEGLSDYVVIRAADGDLEEVSHYEKWESE
jgi:hypothetical protein